MITVMPSAAEITAMQAVANLTHPTSCQIVRPTDTSDGQGGQTRVWNVINTTVCRVTAYKRLDRELVTNERIELANRWVLYFPAGTDLTPRDRVVALGVTYEVTTVEAPASIEIEREVLCYEVQ